MISRRHPCTHCHSNCTRSRLRVPTSSSHFHSVFASVSNPNSHLIKGIHRSFSYRTCLRCSWSLSARHPSFTCCISYRSQRPMDRPIGFHKSKCVNHCDSMPRRLRGGIFLLCFFFPLKICIEFGIHFNFLFYFIPLAHFYSEYICIFVTNLTSQMLVKCYNQSIEFR